MISLRKTLAASSLALGIAATAAPVGAQYYYPSQNYWPDNQVRSWPRLEWLHLRFGVVELLMRWLWLTSAPGIGE
jgi:hypothetical protein